MEVLARKKFLDGCPTVDLIKECSSPVEREEVMAVCLLNLEPENLRAILSNDPEEVVQHVLQCQQASLQKLRQKGIDVTTGVVNKE